MAEHVEVKVDLSGFVSAMDRLAAVLGDFADPMTSAMRQRAMAYSLGQVPCGGDHSGPCGRCGAAV